MQSKVILTNNNQNWNAKRRYRINEVVSYSGSNWQNQTGNNSEPGVSSDWFKINGGGGISDAPMDGNQYGRQNGAWTEIENPISLTDTNTPDLSFVGEVNDLISGAETCNILEGDTLYQWFRIVGDDAGFYLRTADNSTLDNWTTPVPLVGVDGYFPTVFKYENTYYMFFNPADYLTSRKVLFAQSTDKINWTILNGGNTVIEFGSSINDWNYFLFNVGVCMVGSTIHILVEGTEGTSTAGIYHTACMGYASADISNPIFTLSSSPQIIGGGNPQLIYVPEKHSIVVLYGHNYNIWDNTNFKWSLRAATYDLNYDPLLQESWILSDAGFLYMGEVADPELVFTPNKDFKSLMTYNFNQAFGKRAHNNYIDTPFRLYQSLPIAGQGNRLSTGVFTTTTNIQNGVTIEGLDTIGESSQPTLLFKRFKKRLLKTVAFIFSGYAEGGQNDGDLAFFTSNGASSSLAMLLGGITKSCKFPFLSGSGSRLLAVNNSGALIDTAINVSSGIITANSFVKTGSNSNQILLGNGSVAIKPNVYAGTIDDQTGTGVSNPSVSILGDNTIGNIVWTRITTGLLFGTLAGAFPAGKTHLSITPSSPTGNYSIFRNTDDVIVIKTQDNGTMPFTDADGKLFNNSFRIEVYP